MAPRKSKAPATAPSTEPELLQIDIAIPAGARDPKMVRLARAVIHPDPDQPRERADADLRASLATNGQLQPITVRPHPSLLTEYMIVDGERRWLSSEGVLEELFCILREDADDLVMRLSTQLVANTGKPLTPIEEAKAFGRLIQETGMTVADVAKRLGRAKSTVGERIALLELGPWLGEIERGHVVMSHAVKVLLPYRRLADELHTKVIETLTEDGTLSEIPMAEGSPELSVDDFENLVRNAYKPFLYPLTSSKSRGAKNPEFKTTAHDAECGCGGIKIAIDWSGERLCCGNPEWWQPRHKAGLKKKREADKAKASAPNSAAPKGRHLYLPESTETIKVSYGNLPAGVTQLTTNAGEWKTNHELAKQFDPADLVIDEAKLVQWRDYGDYPCVGTKDAAAVKAARAKWDERWAAQKSKIVASVAETLKKRSASYKISGEGLSALIGLFSTEAAEAIAEVAPVIQVEVPASVTNAGRWNIAAAVQKWLAKLSSKDLASLITALATVRELNLKTPAEQIEQLQEKARQNIRAREIPWKKKPKDAKPVPAAKSKPTIAAASKKTRGTAVPAAATLKAKRKPAADAVPLEKLSEETGLLFPDLDDDEDDAPAAALDDDGDDLWDSHAEEDEEALVAGPIVEDDEP